MAFGFQWRSGSNFDEYMKRKNPPRSNVGEHMQRNGLAAFLDELLQRNDSRTSILTPSRYPPTGKGLGALICVLNMPYELGHQMYLAYEPAYVRARFLGDHTFKMDLLSWKQGHTDRTRRREAEDGML